MSSPIYREGKKRKEGGGEKEENKKRKKKKLQSELSYGSLAVLKWHTKKIKAIDGSN